MDKLDAIKELENNILEYIYYCYRANEPQRWPTVKEVKDKFSDRNIPAGLFLKHRDDVLVNLEGRLLIKRKELKNGDYIYKLTPNGTAYVDGILPTPSESKSLMLARLAIIIAAGSFLLSIVVYFINSAS